MVSDATEATPQQGNHLTSSRPSRRDPGAGVAERITSSRIGQTWSACRVGVANRVLAAPNRSRCQSWAPTLRKRPLKAQAPVLGTLRKRMRRALGVRTGSKLEIGYPVEACRHLHADQRATLPNPLPLNNFRCPMSLSIGDLGQRRQPSDFLAQGAGKPVPPKGANFAHLLRPLFPSPFPQLFQRVETSHSYALQPALVLRCQYKAAQCQPWAGIRRKVPSSGAQSCHRSAHILRTLRPKLPLSDHKSLFQKPGRHSSN
jgi:hypothetical protein